MIRYYCDRCKKETKRKDLLRIDIYDPVRESTIFSADLCEECTEMVKLKIYPRRGEADVNI